MELFVHGLNLILFSWELSFINKNLIKHGYNDSFYFDVVWFVYFWRCDVYSNRGVAGCSQGSVFRKKTAKKLVTKLHWYNV